MAASDQTPQVARLNPAGLHGTPGYHRVTVVEAGRTAHLAGQCPIGPGGELVGEGDLAAQIDRIVANSLIALEAVDAGPRDVVRSVIYVVSPDTAVLGGVWRRLLDGPLADAFSTASTLLGVASLGFAGQLAEIDLTVALPR